jgi:hypothetical protein
VSVSPTILDFRMHDGSRHFAELPEACEWEKLREHIALLPGAKVTNYLTDHVVEMWLDFSYQGHDFTVNNPLGSFWFFVRDPGCPDEILTAVGEHCRLIPN